MVLSGNKGEWSEIYTLFRLLGEGKVHAGDADMNKLDIYYPILNIIRKESKKYEYKPDADRHIVVIDEDGVEYARISMSRFVRESQSLLSEIKTAHDSAFSVPTAEKFMSEIGCFKLKAPSTDKADIHIVIHDLRTNMTPTLGFSIKSQLGSASSLLNAGKTTNIIYKVRGAQLTDGQIEEINSIRRHLPRMKALYDAGCSLEYSDFENNTFKNNLLFIDCCMPSFVADCLLVDNMPDTPNGVKEIVKIVAERNPFGFTGKNVVEFYGHKMKAMLLDVALGMTPAKVWNGRYDANGGYIVVRSDGEIVCYHFYNRNDVEDYLFNSTRFERAARGRYDFGRLFRSDDGGVYIKLNLQIRFKS